MEIQFYHYVLKFHTNKSHITALLSTIHLIAFAKWTTESANRWVSYYVEARGKDMRVKLVEVRGKKVGEDNKLLISKDNTTFIERHWSFVELKVKKTDCLWIFIPPISHNNWLNLPIDK